MCLWNIKEKIKKYIYNESVIKSYFGIKLNIKKINIAQFIAIIIFIIWVTFGFTINMLPVKLEFVPLVLIYLGGSPIILILILWLGFHHKL